MYPNDNKTIRMPQALLANWLGALRSGTYLQAQGALERMMYYVGDTEELTINAFDPGAGPGARENRAAGVGYCCLGVLEKCATGSVEMERPNLPKGLPSLGWLHDRHVVFLNRAGRPDGSPWLPTLARSAEDANDSGLYSFAQLADAIEAATETY